MVLIVDLETTWSYKKRYSANKWTDVSDKGSPFTDKNKIVAVGCYSLSNNKYTLFDENKVGDAIEYINSFNTIVGHNIKFDVHWLRKCGLDVKNKKLIDTLVVEFILRGGADTFTKLGLDKVAPIYGGTSKIDIIKKYWENGCNTTDIPKNLLSKYLYMDVWNTYKVYTGQLKHKNYRPLCGVIHMSNDLVSVTEEMEYNGLCINKEIGNNIRKRFEEEIKFWEREVYNLAEKKLPSGDILQLTSSQQLAKLLYGIEIYKPNDSMSETERAKARANYIEWQQFVDSFSPFAKDAKTKLNKAVKKYCKNVGYGFKIKPHPRFISKTGFSTSKKAMEEMAQDNWFTGEAKDFVNAFLELNKRHTWLNSNYWSLAQSVTPDGMVHTNFNQAGTHTGRYSSTNPNLLNLPSRKKNKGQNDIRRMVVSRFGEKGFICSPDFSQIELRVLFQLSKSRKGIEDYKNGIDIHTSKAKWAVDYYYGEGTWENGSNEERKAWRDKQKAVNFGLVYGLSPRDELQKAMFEAFHKDYPEVRVWNEEVKQKILSLGYYESPLTGMRYAMTDATHFNYYRGYDSRGRGWKNKALNFPVQGDAAKLTQIAMIDIYNKIKNDDGIKFIGQVYDEILLDVHEKELDKAKEICLNSMNNVHIMVYKYFGTELLIPIEASWEQGRDWFGE